MIYAYTYTTVEGSGTTQTRDASPKDDGPGHRDGRAEERVGPVVHDQAVVMRIQPLIKKRSKRGKGVWWRCAATS